MTTLILKTPNKNTKEKTIFYFDVHQNNFSNFFGQ